MYEGMDPSSLLAAAGDEQRASRICTFRMHVAAGRLAAWRLPESDAERVQWCVDGWEAVAAEVSAELGISRGRASTVVEHGLTLLFRLPKLAEVCLTGAVDFRVFRLIQFRTGLVTDPEILDRLDTTLAQEAPRWNSLSEEKMTALIDWQVISLDPEAQRVAKDYEDDRYVDIRPDAHGMATISGSLPAADGAVVDARVEAIASTVCAKDPRTKRARRVDAMVAMSEGATTLTCNCNTSDCTAKGSRDATPSQVVIYVIAEEATVSGSGTTPGYLPGFGAVPAETVRNLATRAKIRPLARPQDLSAETSYRPSRKLAEFVDYRDLTCRFPGCTTVAQRCDTDHTVPYPLGPTHPSDLKLYCRVHHLLKTFYTGPGGWHDVQKSDGTIVFRSPSGRVYSTVPVGSLFFPQLATPTGELVLPSDDRPEPAAKTLKMPTRRRPRAVEKAARVEWERGVNRARIAADPPPF